MPQCHVNVTAKDRAYEILMPSPQLLREAVSPAPQYFDLEHRRSFLSIKWQRYPPITHSRLQAAMESESNFGDDSHCTLQAKCRKT